MLACAQKNAKGGGAPAESACLFLPVTGGFYVTPHTLAAIYFTTSKLESSVRFALAREVSFANSDSPSPLMSSSA